MERVLEFALVVVVVNAINITFAFWVGISVGNKITELFDIILTELNNVPL